MEKTNSRVAMGLICGLAICCAVMYITADGSDVSESILQRKASEPVHDIGGPASVDSEDVEKAGTVITNTPDGRMRLTDYLTNVEKEIAAEQAARKRDVKAVRAQMARNFAFNKAARAKLEKKLLVRMAKNAKTCKDNLAKAMRWVQGKFAKAAALQNKRQAANLARSKKMRATIEANKKEAHANLEKAVLAQQRAMSTLKAKTNARIRQTNKHVAQNAAQIKENAKAAQHDLDAAVAKYDKKVANARAEAAKGRSKLATQLANQDKSMRQWADNRMKVVMAKTAAQFRRVRAKMAADRLHADNALKVATTKMNAGLNAYKALNNKRFAKTVKDIAAAKKEAKARVAAAKRSFKIGLFRLSSTIKDQVGKANARIDQLTMKVQKHKVAQAKINGNVNAEIKRMIKIGQKRYQQHLKKDKELQGLINKNKAATDKALKGMAAHYTMEINAVRHTMKKNRAHATHMLAKESSKLYSAIAKNEAAQMKTNGALRAQTTRARLDIQDSLREAKQDFAKRIGALHKTVVKNDKKFEKKMDKLTGIVRQDAVKNAEGRKELKEMMAANKNELNAAVRDAIHKGETRMAAAETKLMKLNKKTKAALNVKITASISKLTKRANDQIEGLRLNSAEARKEMKKELLYAIRSMADEAKKNLDDAVAVATKAFAYTNKQQARAAKKSAADRARIALRIKINAGIAKQKVVDATSTMHKALLSLKTETSKKIKKTNKRVDAYGAAIDKEAKDVAVLMKAQMTKLTTKINRQKAAASRDTKAADAKSIAGFKSVMSTVESTLKKAAKKSNRKFNKLYSKMAKQRQTLDKNLAAAVDNINDSIAKQSALADTRFEKTVKDIKAARAQAKKQVREARSDFAQALNGLTSKIKQMDTKLTGDVMVVAGECISHKAMQARVNRHVSGEINRIDTLMNHHNSVSKKARGKLRKILDENKRAAAEEVKSLGNMFKGKIAAIRSEAAKDSLAARKDLTKSTMKMYGALAEAQKANLYRSAKSARAIGKYSKTALANIAATRKNFNSRLNFLTNVVAANHKKVEKGFEVLTGVIRNYKTAGKNDRKVIREQNKTLNTNMNKAIVTAMQIGEARAKKVAQEARENLSGAKKALLIEITNTVEEYADKTFKTIQGKHGKIADNYLSLKAYAVSASKLITAYVGQGKGKNLSSLGDLLTNIAGLSSVKPGKAEGISPSSTLSAPFSGKKIKVKNSVNKINGLVNEFIECANGVRERWNMGLGKYLLSKLMMAMRAKGVLQVDKIEGKSGNWVFMNGHAVGLSNKLNDFEGLAVRMGSYEKTLAKLSAKLSGKHIKPHKQMQYMAAPEWKGD
jgi:hypothetical protein